MIDNIILGLFVFFFVLFEEIVTNSPIVPYKV